jgi:hypothetical protein
MGSMASEASTQNHPNKLSAHFFLERIATIPLVKPGLAKKALKKSNLSKYHYIFGF